MTLSYNLDPDIVLCLRIGYLMKCLSFRYSGSRDSHVCLWKVQDQEETQEADSESQAIRVPEYFSIKPTAKRPCSKAEKVRAIAFNDQTGVSCYRRVIVYLNRR